MVGGSLENGFLDSVYFFVIDQIAVIESAQLVIRNFRGAGQISDVEKYLIPEQPADGRVGARVGVRSLIENRQQGQSADERSAILTDKRGRIPKIAVAAQSLRILRAQRINGGEKAPAFFQRLDLPGRGNQKPGFAVDLDDIVTIWNFIRTPEPDSISIVSFNHIIFR